MLVYDRQSSLSFADHAPSRGAEVRVGVHSAVGKAADTGRRSFTRHAVEVCTHDDGDQTAVVDNQGGMYVVISEFLADVANRRSGWQGSR